MFHAARSAALASALTFMLAGHALAHNFVDFDLTAKAPKPLPPYSWISVELLDTDSGARNGDLVSFDVLSIAQNFQGTLNPATHEASYRTWVAARTERYQASCSWRTIQGQVVETRGDFTDSISPPPHWTRITPLDSRYRVVLDDLCAGRPLSAANGLSSADAAMAVWKDMFQKPGDRVTPITVARRAMPVAPDWVTAANPHQFTKILEDAATGNALYLDRASLTPDGSALTGLSFLLLGPQAQQDNARATAYAVGAEHRVRYDCAANTMTVLSEALWNAKGEFTQSSATASSPRAAAESAAAGAEIKAACAHGNPAHDEKSFASVEDIWAAARAH